MFDQDHNRENVVQKLINHFYNASLDFTLQPLEIESLTWDEQQKILNATVHNETVIKYPMSFEFCRLFFKKVINFLEPKNEVHDDFYTFLCTILKSNTHQDFCFRHYIIGNDLKNLITIKETKNMVVNGTTGMRTWQAALMLADYAICNKDKFRGKNLIELGSGVGFTGITIAKLCEINSILLSDCHDDVLQTIYENVHLNFPSLEIGEQDNMKIFKRKNKQNIGVMRLDWNFIEDVPNYVVPDVLIGSDIIYDPSILKPLCGVIKTFCNRNQSLEVYIANVIRNDETYESFLQILLSMDLLYEEVLQTKCVYIEWDCNIKRCLLKIKSLK